jgi:crotonobetainyl-CoA:carnitine CoA-transferase CaiB-like acyl-CoA transferase
MVGGDGALANLRVLDLTRILAGPFCTQILSDHGANIVKVEALEGDETRRWGPPFDAEGMSAYFRGVNRNKRSVAINLASGAGQSVLLRLLEHTDIVVENFKAGQMEKWGLGYESTLRALFPSLVYAQITGYGSNGPMAGLPGFDAIAQVMSGLASINGVPNEPPVRVGTPISDLSAGLYITSAIMMALYERGSTSLGQKVEVSLLDCSVSLLHPHAANYFVTNEAPVRMGNAHPNISPYQMFQTTNGWIFIAGGNNKQFELLVSFLGMPELVCDDRFIDNASRKTNETALNLILAPLFKEQNGFLLAQKLLREGVPAGAVLEVPQVLEQEQLHVREMVVEKDGYKGLGTPIKMSRTPGKFQAAPPQLGQHSRAVLNEADFTDDEIEELLQSGTILSSP